jgi:RNA polymerase sigma factor (TIGR02999 family)
MKLSADVTQLLIEYRDGKRDAFPSLVESVYDDLRRVARSQLRRERIRDGLNTTALVHESYVRLADVTRLSVRDRGHFFAIAAIAMRRIIVDFARERTALKRGGDMQRVPLDDDAVASTHAVHVVDVHEALGRLEQADPTLARVVECRFFAGYSEQETADALGLSLRNAQRAWARARAWLQMDLGQDGGR